MINPLNYVVCIPTLQRSTTIANKTLKVLSDKLVSPSRIFLFVASEIEYDDYMKNVPNKLFNKIIIGEYGIKNQRNFITNYFEENICILEMDDDLKDINYLLPGIEKKFNEIYPILDLHNFILEAFNNLIEKNAYTFGCYPVNNPYFMTNKITTDLRFLMGGFFGFINRHNQDLLLELNEKDDFERTLKFYISDDIVIRYNNISIDTTIYKGTGGMQEYYKDRYLEAEKSANYLVAKYPDYCKKWYKGKSQRPEIKFHRSKKS